MGGRKRGPCFKFVDRSCGGKTEYKDQALAVDAARQLREWDGARLKPYKCPFCQGWHLTSRGKGVGNN